MAGTLPSMLREDPFASQFCTGLDEVLAPVWLSLDSFAAYLDLGTTPEDMLPWLAHWLGVSVDPASEPASQRELLQAARELHAIRGTRDGIALAVRTALGVEAQVTETGAASWSESAGGNLPGEAVPRVVVVVRAPADRELDLDRLDAVITSALPAHVRYRVQVDN